MKGNILRFKQEDLKRHVIYKNITAIKAYEILEEIVNGKSGFNVFRLPPVEFLLNCIYTLKPDHEIFAMPSKSYPTRLFPMEFNFF